MTARRPTQFLRTELLTLVKNTRIIQKNDGLDIKVAKFTGDMQGKVLIITPKASGNSPQRNYLRRCSKEIYAQLNLASEPYSWVLYFKKREKFFTFHEILTCWQNALIACSQRFSR